MHKFRSTTPGAAAKTRRVSLAELKAESTRRRGVLQRMRALLPRRTAPALKRGEEQVNVLWGNTVTWFVDSAGEGIGIGGPPLHAAHIAKHEVRARRFFGRSLTRHIDHKAKVTDELHRLAQAPQRPLPL